MLFCRVIKADGETVGDARERGIMQSKRWRLALALALLMMWPQAGRAAEETPALVQGWQRLAVQAAAGRQLSAEVTLVPEYLPLRRTPGAAELSTLLTGLSVAVETRQATGEDDLSLTATLADHTPLWSLSRRLRGDAAEWRSLYWPQTIAAPAEADLWGALLGSEGDGIAALLFAPWHDTQPGLAQLSALDNLLRKLPERIELPAEQVNPLLAALIGELVPEGTLREALASWQAVTPLTVRPAWTEAGGWTRLRLAGAIGRAGEAPWQLTADLRRSASGRQQTIRADISLTQDKQNTLTLAFSSTARTAGKTKRTREGGLTISGKLGGYSLNFRLREQASNAFAEQDGELTEQLRCTYTLSGSTGEPRWEKSDMNKWAATVKMNGTLRSREAAEARISGEGQVRVELLRSGTKFFAGTMPWQLATGAAQPLSATEAPLPWAELDEPLRAAWQALTEQGVQKTLLDYGRKNSANPAETQKLP